MTDGSDAELCILCEKNPAEIRKEDGAFCCFCWQDKTDPSMEINIIGRSQQQQHRR